MTRFFCERTLTATDTIDWENNDLSQSELVKLNNNIGDALKLSRVSAGLANLNAYILTNIAFFFLAIRAIIDLIIRIK